MDTLTHLSWIEFPILNWAIPFTFKGLLGGIFEFYSNLNRILFKQIMETLIWCRWSDTTFCGVWSWSALFTHVQQKVNYAYMG